MIQRVFGNELLHKNKVTFVTIDFTPALDKMRIGEDFIGRLSGK